MSWEAREAQERHARATDHIRTLQDRVRELEARLTERDQRVQALERLLAEERSEFASLLAMAHTSRPQPGDNAIAAPLPLTGKRVVVVGGDTIASEALEFIQSIGGEVQFCEGFTKEARVARVAARADQVVAVTAAMTHKHSGGLKQAQARGARVVWVNQLGLGAFRRTVLAALGPQVPATGVASGQGAGSMLAAHASWAYTFLPWEPKEYVGVVYPTPGRKGMYCVRPWDGRAENLTEPQIRERGIVVGRLPGQQRGRRGGLTAGAREGGKPVAGIDGPLAVLHRLAEDDRQAAQELQSLLADGSIRLLPAERKSIGHAATAVGGRREQSATDEHTNLIQRTRRYTPCPR